MMHTLFQVENAQISTSLVASAMFEYGADNGKIKKRYQRYPAIPF